MSSSTIAGRGRATPNGYIIADRAKIPVRHQGAGGLRPFARAQVRHLFRRRAPDLRQAPGQPGPRISGRADLCALGRRLSEVRLVQHRRPQCEGSLCGDGGRAPRRAAAPIVFSMCEWGTAKPWLWAKNSGNLWRTTGDIWDSFATRETRRMTGRIPMHRHRRPKRAAVAVMPGPVTGMIPTCSKSAMAA